MADHHVVVLDLDGVIVKSNLIKHRAMLSLFSEHATLRTNISDYILAHGGVPRRDKLAAILREIVGVPADEAVLSRYLQRYAMTLEHELNVAPLVDGVEQFIRQGTHVFYVSSSAPAAEVRAQLARRSLDGCFSRIYGADTPKADALREIVARHPQATVVFFGDSLGDLEAAREAGVAFVAVVSERDNFAGRDVTKLVDFRSSSRVQACLSGARR